MNPIHNTGNVALTLQLCLMDSHYVMHYTMSSLYTVKKHYLSIKGTLFHFTALFMSTLFLCPKCMYFLCLLNFCAPNVYYDNSNGKKNYIKMN